MRTVRKLKPRSLDGERRIGREQNLARVMSEAVVKIARYTVPERAKMFRVPAAEVLWRADILRGSEFDLKKYRSSGERRAPTIDCGFTDYARFMDVVSPEMYHLPTPLVHLVSVVMAIRATASALTNSVC